MTETKLLNVWNTIYNNDNSNGVWAEPSLYTKPKISNEEIDYINKIDVSKSITVNITDLDELDTLIKLGWLIGNKAILITTPFILYEDKRIDMKYEEGGWKSDITKNFYIDKRFIVWKEKLNKIFNNPPILLPAINIYHSKKCTEDEWSPTIKYGVDKTFIDNKYAINNLDFLNTLESITKIDIPCILIEKKELLEKVMEDYPTATIELKHLITGIYDIVSSNETDELSENDKIMKINDEYISPSIIKIKREYKSLMRSKIIKTIAEPCIMSIPFLIGQSIVPHELITKILTAGVGIDMLKNILAWTKDTFEIKEKPFYAAWKMELKSNKSTKRILNI